MCPISLFTLEGQNFALKGNLFGQIRLADTELAATRSHRRIEAVTLVFQKIAGILRIKKNSKLYERYENFFLGNLRLSSRETIYLLNEIFISSDMLTRPQLLFGTTSKIIETKSMSAQESSN